MEKKHRGYILVADDEKNIREGLSKIFESDSYKVYQCADGKETYHTFMTRPVDVAIVDIRMPGMTGLEFLEKAKSADVPIILITGHGDVETAVEAMQLGAYDFLIKPVDVIKLELIVKRIMSEKRNRVEAVSIAGRSGDDIIRERIIYKSPAMDHVVERVKQTAKSKANVYIYGESGTGKEVICDVIHYYSGVKGPLVKVNCSALSPTLLESELFGHERGAFTGANSLRVGRFEAAKGGTIFLDEISEVSKEIQVKLLRVLQEKTIERVGSSQTIDVDFRVVCASNKDLITEVERGNFREDLFYRLNVIDIRIPPLRERREDIEPLAVHFFKTFMEENDKRFSIDPKVYQALSAYDWPGNIRELRNIIERMVILCRSETLTLEDVPQTVRSVRLTEESIMVPYGLSMEEAEKIIILETLRYYHGNRSKTAQVLGLGRKTIQRKLKSYE